MLHEKLKELDILIAGSITKVSSKVLHTLLDEMKSLIEWNNGSDGIKYAFDKTTGEILIKLDADGKIMYSADNLPPMSVLFV